MQLTSLTAHVSLASQLSCDLLFENQKSLRQEVNDRNLVDEYDGRHYFYLGLAAQAFDKMTNPEEAAITDQIVRREVMLKF